MTKKNVEDFLDIADLMYSNVIEEGKCVAFVGDFLEVTELLRSMFIADGDENLFVSLIDISDPDFRDYEFEYLLSIMDDGTLWVDKAAKDDGELFNMCGEYDVVYTRPGHVEKIKEKADEVCVLCFDGEDYEIENRSLHLITDDDGKLKGFSFSDEGHGVCFNMELCSCEEIDTDSLTSLIDRLLEAYTR